MLYDTLIAPFAEFEFMRRALVGTIALALGAGPVGVFLMLRRMSLVGDAMAHAILPGAAVGFLLSGLNLFAMTAGGLVAGFVVALAAGLVARAHFAFLGLLVMNLVGGFNALGTLLAVGIMMLPAATGRFWARDMTAMILIAAGSGAVAGYAGLLLSFHTSVPSGPAIILVAG